MRSATIPAAPGGTETAVARFAAARYGLGRGGRPTLRVSRHCQRRRIRCRRGARRHRRAHHAGIDLSSAALGIAPRNLAALACPVERERGDFTAAAAAWQRPVGVALGAPSLQHLPAPRRLAAMRDVRRILAAGGPRTSSGWIASGRAGPPASGCRHAGAPRVARQGSESGLMP
jgi:hypothetical protein